MIAGAKKLPGAVVAGAKKVDVGAQTIGGKILKGGSPLNKRLIGYGAGVAGAGAIAGVGGVRALKKGKTAEEIAAEGQEVFKLTTKTAEFYNFGIQMAMDALQKEAADPESEITMEMVEKIAEMRAERVLFSVKVGAQIDTLQDLIDGYKEIGEDKIAEQIFKYAEGELEQIEAPAGPESPEVVEAEGDEESTEEEAQVAAVQGAAEVIADLTGKEPTDPEIQEAAVEVVEDAVSTLEAEAGGEVAEEVAE